MHPFPLQTHLTLGSGRGERGGYLQIQATGTPLPTRPLRNNLSHFAHPTPGGDCVMPPKWAQPRQRPVPGHPSLQQELLPPPRPPRPAAPETPRRGAEGPGPGMALRAPFPHLARSHLRARAERGEKQAGRADLVATDSRAAHPAASWKAARRTFFSPWRKETGGRRRRWSGRAVQLQRGRSGDYISQAAPGRLASCDPGAHRGADSYLTEVAPPPPPPATRRPAVHGPEPRADGQEPGSRSPPPRPRLLLLLVVVVVAVARRRPGPTPAGRVAPLPGSWSSPGRGRAVSWRRPPG